MAAKKTPAGPLVHVMHPEEGHADWPQERPGPYVCAAPNSGPGLAPENAHLSDCPACREGLAGRAAALQAEHAAAATALEVALATEAAEDEALEAERAPLLAVLNAPDALPAALEQELAQAAEADLAALAPQREALEVASRERSVLGARLAGTQGELTMHVATLLLAQADGQPTAGHLEALRRARAEALALPPQVQAALAAERGALAELERAQGEANGRLKALRDGHPARLARAAQDAEAATAQLLALQGPHQQRRQAARQGVADAVLAVRRAERRIAAEGARAAEQARREAGSAA